MGMKLEKLLSIASNSLGKPVNQLPSEIITLAGSFTSELEPLLAIKNGFLGFESALHLFPVGPVIEGYNLTDWNRDDLWRFEYEDMAKGYLFFAEDIFGEQFCIQSNNIYRFNPETGDSEEMAHSLEEWAGRILEDYEFETGYSLAHEWQQHHGFLPLGKRLIPITPFVGGGKYELENLHLLDAAEGMRLRAALARQIRDLPDGTQIQFKMI